MRSRGRSRGLAAATMAAACLTAAACGGATGHPSTGDTATGHTATKPTASGPKAGSSVIAENGNPAPADSGGQTPFTATGPVVALGDSYTAGQLLPLDMNAEPLGCLRSTVNYPSLVAKALHATSFTDASCESAGAADMTSPEKTRVGINPPQLDAVKPGDSLIMLTLGGDDLGFSHVLDTCMQLSFRDPLGSPCESRYAPQLQGLFDTETHKMVAALTAIRQKAPRARVLLLGYPDLFPAHGGCWPVVPITSKDDAFLLSAEIRLNQMLATVAGITRTTYVDTFTSTIGHDFCQKGSVKDIEGLIPTSTAYSFHPNARGQAAMAARVLAVLGRG